MILFQEIFERAVNLFDDPEINQAYLYDPVKFEQMMRVYLINGKAKFNRPQIIASALGSYTSASGKAEVFQGNGGKEYTLSEGNVPVDNSAMSFKINGQLVNGEYDPETKKVVFERDITEEENCSFEWYYSGAFTINAESLFKENGESNAELIKDVLTRCLCLAWADKTRNFLLEIKNIMSDTEFKVHSAANALEARNAWRLQIEKEIRNDITALGWAIKNGGNIVGR